MTMYDGFNKLHKKKYNAVKTVRPSLIQFNPALPISSETHGFVVQPSFADKIHCVAFVINASSIEDIPPILVKTIINAHKNNQSLYVK